MRRQHGEQMTHSRTRSIATIGLLAALTVVLGWLETMAPLPVAIPGIKLGLANICVLFALRLLGVRQAALLMLIKIAVTAALFGSLFSLAYSAAGSLLAFLGMWLMLRSKRFNCVAASVAGAVLHNLGQLAIAFALTATPLVALNIPVLTIAACITGTITGTVATAVIAAMSQQTRLLAPHGPGNARRREGSRDSKGRQSSVS
jgi:heptaprenyl diphosphate synthase